MGPLGRATRSRVIYSISIVGATRWRQWVGAVALYYPITSKRNKPHATSATVPGETAMVKRLLGALRTGPMLCFRWRSFRLCRRPVYANADDEGGRNGGNAPKRCAS